MTQARGPAACMNHQFPWLVKRDGVIPSCQSIADWLKSDAFMMLAQYQEYPIAISYKDLTSQIQDGLMTILSLLREPLCLERLSLYWSLALV